MQQKRHELYPHEVYRPWFARPWPARPRSARPWLTAHAGWCFWLCFALLNLLLFLPLALLDADTPAWMPPASIFADGLRPALTQLLIRRSSLDPLRISVELVLAVALWVNLRPLRLRPVAWLFAFLYLLMLAYAVYEAVVLSIYRADPVFYNHYFLARDGVPFLFEHLGASPWFYAFAGLGALAALALVAACIRLLLASGAQIGPLGRGVTAGAAALCLAAVLWFQGGTAQVEMVASSLSWKLHQNIAASLQLQNTVATYDDASVRNVYDYGGYKLEKKPDIYLIFVESYGSVLYKRPDFRAAYTTLLAELEDELAGDGWQSASALSRSTTWGGGSWMAYTSLLFGLRIDNQPQYLELRDRYQVVDYPDLGTALQLQGYHYAWVSSLEEELSAAAWARYENFLAPDRWLRYDDLDYSGPLYGWGPALPDQYMLHYANDLLQRESDQPLLFVTITQNSHYPWDLPPALLPDWRTFNTMPPQVTTTGDEIAHADKRQRYLAAIEYELRMLVDFIRTVGDDDSIFILVGDHQPPQVSRRADGWETPLHIVAKDPALLAAFGEYGLVNGLQVDMERQALHHEGIYSLLMRVLYATYGNRQVAGPGYLPDGAN